jgi:hypothetical protein
MKRKKIVFAALLAALLSFGVSPANTLPQSQVLAIRKAVADTAYLELTPKAVELVRKAGNKDKEQVAVTVVQTILSKRPNLATGLVEALTKAAPEVSSAVAAAAAKICPDQVEAISKIAVTNAPQQASQIAASVATAVPKAARQIARSMIVAAPITAPQVMESIIAAVPNSEVQLNSDPTLASISALARVSRSSAATAPRAGSIGKKPSTNAPATPPGGITNAVAAPRSVTVDNAVKQFQTLETSPTVQVAVLSAATISTINTLNVIGRDTTTTKQDKDAIINQTVNAVSTIIVDPNISNDQKTTSATATARVIATVMTDPDLTLANKQTLVTFVGTQVQSITANPSNTSNSQGEGIKSVAAAITLAIAGTQTFTTAQLTTVTNNVAQTASNVIRLYGSP